ncbi:MAG: DNA methyltransferase [Candidatus Wildermuthbacteria bacterium RIFCSPLOWO2_01_FULL_48_35]|uniref:site-specific DNA-methyltransferase (adenine-specific) n=1 Tax=Candidatus Wildermuthbacteria bacterium RIFCSPLOWO2_01_FULL_48_35 TaxID=1802463 RepID=A0A1G2RNY1_9BACT|nr:MAG: DNA methyltransferase [Candidatus Wildermuthbacteria bacterium RIFCSPLOWO2_01_FULL_48_35]
MSNIQSVIKNIQDIMRKDAGVDGDAQRLSQLVWMLFLKIFDDQERERELINLKYHSPLPEELRWRNWAADPEGMTGDGLLEFVNNKLFKRLKDLSFDESEDPRAFIVREVFADSYNYMKSGTLIRQVINKINEIDFNKADDRHAFNDLYEHLLKELQSAGNAGEYYTPRPLTRFVVEMVSPKLGEKVLDPACGTGGFLIDTLEYIRKQEVKTAADEKKLQSQIHGVELKPLPHLLAITNMILHGVDTPKTLRRGDMLAQPLREYGPKDRVDVITANPPFGGAVKDGVEKNFPAEFRTRETADLFLVLFIHLLKPNGRAGIVLPDGSLFGEGVKTAIKKKLLEECNVHTIVRLPQGVFNPYAGVNTNLIFFTKGEPTKEIWYYQLPLPEGVKQYTKNRGITHEEFDLARRSLGVGGAGPKVRKENKNMWKVSIKQIQERNYNLDFKNPNGRAKVEHTDPKKVLENIATAEKQIAKILSDIRANL